MKNVLAHLKVGFDLDGVLAHTDAAAVGYFKTHGLVPAATTAADVTTWNYDECFPDVTREEWQAMFRQDKFFRGIDADQDALGVVRELAKHGAEIHVVTHRDWRPSDRIDTVWWLNHWGVPYDRLEFCAGDQKPFYVGRWEMDYFIEDHPKTAWGIGQRIRHLSFLRDKPYNQKYDPHGKLVRFYEWHELREFFRL